MKIQLLLTILLLPCTGYAMQQEISRKQLEEELHEVRQLLSIEFEAVLPPKEIKTEPVLEQHVIKDIDYEIQEFNNAFNEQRAALKQKKTILKKRLQSLPHPMIID